MVFWRQLVLLLYTFGSVALKRLPGEWESVCELEEERALSRPRHYYSVPQLERFAGPIVYQVGGVRRERLPLTIMNGTRLVVRMSNRWLAGRDFAMDASLGGKPSCKVALQRKRRFVELVLKMDEVVYERNQSAAPKWPPPEALWDRPASRLVVRAVVCAKNGSRIYVGHSRAIITPSLSGAHEMRCQRSDRQKTQKRPLPPPSNPETLDAVLAGDPEAKIMVKNATDRLAASLTYRGVLCDISHPCEATLLDSCPLNCAKRVEADDASPDCLFASSAKKKKHTNDICIRVCVSPLAWRHVWKADVSRGKDDRDLRARDCRVAHVHGLAQWYRNQRSSMPFTSIDDEKNAASSEEKTPRLKKEDNTPLLLREERKSSPFVVSPLLKNQTLRRCAVVGSGHTLRCGTRWGPIIDSFDFDAVFRVNKIQFEPWTREAGACRSGVRTDFVVNAFAGESADKDLTLPARFVLRALSSLGGGAIAKSPEDYAITQRALDKFKYSRQSRESDYRDYLRGLATQKTETPPPPPSSSSSSSRNNTATTKKKVSPRKRRRRRSTKEQKRIESLLQNKVLGAVSRQNNLDFATRSRRLLNNDRIPDRFFPPLYLPTRRSRLLGSGSGSTALVVALSACRHVDFFGFGVFQGNSKDFDDFRYLHFYQDIPSAASSGGAQVFNSELRNHLFDAFGVANFIWW